MSTLDTVATLLGRPSPPPKEIPQDIQARMDRGRKRMLKDAAKRRLCQRFRRGDSYWFINSKGLLDFQSTVTSVRGGGKPPHRIRNRYDFIGPIIDAKVSAATQRIPSYETTPTTTDPEDVGGAKMAEKVALYGYDKWRLRGVSTKVVDLAIGGGGAGFAMPYFEPNVGPYTEVEGRYVGRGEIRVLTLSANQVYWEPGVDFEDSPWYVVERARPIDELQQIPGYCGGKLTPDASSSDIPTDRDVSDNLAMVREYFERPCPKYPQGRCMTFAGGKPIVDYRLINPMAEQFWSTYPMLDHQGQVLDEPLIHRLVYRHDPETDSDLGLTWALIDFQRTAQDCWNKLLEWKNRCLNPQMIAPTGSFKQRYADEPGAVRYFDLIGNGTVKPEWERVPTEFAGPLFSMLDRIVSDMRAVAADSQFEAAPDIAAKTIGEVALQNRTRWESFLGDLEEFHSRLMRHCLLLVARHYSEPRLLAIRGRWGQPQRIQDFMGRDLLGQVDIRVTPGSLAARSRQQVQQELAWIQANWPGYLTPEVAIAALHNGTAEDLIRGYDLDMARVNGIIQAILDGTVMDLPARQEWMPPQTDPMTGQEISPGGMQEVPSYMPGENDALPIWRKMFGDWMKTQEYGELDPPMQEVANQIWAGIRWRESQAAQQALEARNAQAMELGAENAAKPQVKGVPSQPGDGVSPPAQP